MTPPGHDSREERALRAFLDMRRKLDDALNRQLSRDAGLSAADFQLLMPLARAPREGLRPRDLGREVGWDRSRLAHHLRRMFERGLITREDYDEDARGCLIRLTGQGRSAVEAAAASARSYLFEVLTPEEVDTLTSISDQVLRRIATGSSRDPA